MAAEVPIAATLTMEYTSKDVTADLSPEAAEWLLEAMRNQSVGNALFLSKDCYSTYQRSKSNGR